MFSLPVNGCPNYYLPQALLLSHPRSQTRDTQYHAGKHKLLNTKYPALRNLVKQELDVTIQGGEHSSVGVLSILTLTV
jgi:hypothetical protein